MMKTMSAIALAGTLAACTVGRPATPTAGGVEGGSSGAFIGWSGNDTDRLRPRRGGRHGRRRNLGRHRPRCCGLLTGIALRRGRGAGPVGPERPDGIRRGIRRGLALLIFPEAIALESALRTAASSPSTSSRARSMEVRAASCGLFDSAKTDESRGRICRHSRDLLGRRLAPPHPTLF